MGRIEKEGEDLVYKQDDGETTAVLTDFEERMVLSHEGSPTYNKVFYGTVFIGALYLCLILLLY